MIPGSEGKIKGSSPPLKERVSGSDGSAVQIREVALSATMVFNFRQFQRIFSIHEVFSQRKEQAKRGMSCRRRESSRFEEPL